SRQRRATPIAPEFRLIANPVPNRSDPLHHPLPTRRAIPNPGLYEALLTARLKDLVEHLPGLELAVEVSDLASAESADRVSRHVAQLVSRAIEAIPENQRAEGAVRIAVEILDKLAGHADHRLGLEAERPVKPGQVLQSILRRRLDGSPDPIERPLTPLLDTTVLTNAPGEP